MYSTRRLNSRMVDGNAYVTVGDPYVTCKDVVPDRFKGKKFTVIRRPENAGNGMFSKVTEKSLHYFLMSNFSGEEK